MTTQDVIELVRELNQTDEHPRLEAKTGVGHALYETICSLSNEPSLGGGTILLGVPGNEDDFFGGYEIAGVDSPDRVSQEIASSCATMFNRPVRPRVIPVPTETGIVVVVEVDELAQSEKPLFFKSQNLPRGAWRRVGSTDQRCTEEDLAIFYSERDRDPYDARLLTGATLQDLDPEAIEHYRKLRALAHSTAEELKYEDVELLQALNAARPDDSGTLRPTLTGLLLFGKRLALRRELPAMRVDYIRVAGKDWVPDPDKRYESTTDMRGPLLQLVDRAQAAVVDDLPRGFDLPEGSIQAVTPSLPARALREAIVNALMHRSYRVHDSTQIIRYSNRIEIRNAGFSLKNEDQLGTPGSQLRNPNIAAVFHETNTAETKGTGIRVMREQMKKNGFSPPTFESDRGNDRFTARFLLHHFLSESDLVWLKGFKEELSEAQRYALIFARESGAIDNPTLRQLTGGEVLSTSQELRRLRDLQYLEKKGGGNATYYVPGPFFPRHPDHDTLDTVHGTLDSSHDTLAGKHDTLAVLRKNLPGHLKQALANLGARPGNSIRPVILQLCGWQALKAADLAALLGDRAVFALKRDHLRPLVEEGRLALTHPEMERHPDQAYRITEQN